MRWQNRYRGLSTRPRRPAARKLEKGEQQKLLEQFESHVRQSPVLTALGCKISAQRGRFYVDSIGIQDEELWGRITPLEETRQYLLERESGSNQWYEIARGGPKKLVAVIAGDAQGTFHGLGTVDAALRAAVADQSLLEIVKLEQGGGDNDEAREDVCPVFAFRATGRRCTAQEALHLYFGIPLDVLIEPRGWYVRHRRPVMVEHSADRGRVLVRFCSSSWSGDPISGTCLYVRHDEEPPTKGDEASEAPVWAAYTIRPSASETLASAEAWIVKRKWKAW